MLLYFVSQSFESKFVIFILSKNYVSKHFLQYFHNIFTKGHLLNIFVTVVLEAKEGYEYRALV